MTSALPEHRETVRLGPWTTSLILILPIVLWPLISMHRTNQRQPAPRDARLRLDPNRASLAQLQALPGIGYTRARAIVRYREAQARNASADEVAFRTLHDLDSVYGIGQKTIDNLAPYLHCPGP